MRKKYLICLVIISCLNFLIAHDSYAARRQTSHRDHVYVEVGVLISAITASIYFYSGGSKTSDFQSSDSFSKLKQPDNSDNSIKFNFAMNLLKNLFVSPDKLILIEW
jgi:hypothetical protein